INICESGRFSADRTIADYAEHVWKIVPTPISSPADSSTAEPDKAAGEAPAARSLEKKKRRFFGYNSLVPNYARGGFSTATVMSFHGLPGPAWTPAQRHGRRDLLAI